MSTWTNQKVSDIVIVGSGNSLQGSVGTKERLIGHTQISSNLPTYNGEHTVIPSASDVQVLQTAQKVMNSNITIEKIPYNEVSNTTGGVTVTIGG